MKNETLTLGSLFDGSGGFPLAGILAGVTPVWASEVEPFPIRVTTKRLPTMKHYGDVSALKGAELPPVDIITFGSPCQDMSVAGKRAGLDGSRSGLFHEAIRVVREMREATNGEKPRYILWENVPGAFSSNGGEDFRAVLTEVCGIADEAVSLPAPEEKWNKSGEIVGDGYSVAWRVLDAQYWGVAQRRARIFLVADFGGECAGDLLFIAEGLCGNTAESWRAWQRAARDTEGGAGEAGKWCVNPQGCSGVTITEDVTGTLVAQDHGHHPAVMQAAGFCTEHSAQARSIGYEEEKAPTLRAGIVPAAIALEHHPIDSRIKIDPDNLVQTLCERMGTGGGNVPLVMTPDGPLVPYTLKTRCGHGCGGRGALVQTDKSATLATNNDQTLFQPAYGISKEAYRGGDSANFNFSVKEEVSPTLQATEAGAVAQPTEQSQDREPEITAFGISSDQSHAMLSDNPHAGIYEAKTSRTLDQGCNDPGCHQGGIAVVEKVYSLQGNMIGREDHNGPQGSGVNEDVSFTLDSTDRHAVAAPAYSATVGSFMSVSEDKAQTLMARDYKDPQVVSQEPYYIVRRLTPTECARLQGFPDWWCSGLGTEDPTDEEVAFWMDVFETHRKVITHAEKPKTEKQVRKWLKDPYLPSAEYRMWGNGIALPCGWFVLSAIVYNHLNSGEL